MVEHDSFFRISEEHDVCQDYALSGKSSDLYYSIVSDGCSSSPHTDFGSRILTMIAEKQIKLYGFDFDIENVAKEAEVIIKILGLPEEALDATLMCLISDGNTIRAYANGDGAILARQNNGILRVWSINYTQGYPAYPTYLLNDDRCLEYMRVSNGAERTIKEIDSEYKEATQAICKGLEGDYLEFSKKDFSLVAISSDGFFSFKKSNNTSTSIGFKDIDVLELASVLLDFKHTKGSFLKRKCHKFFLKYCEEQKWENHDDFSMAVLAF